MMYYNKDLCANLAANRSTTLNFLTQKYARDENGVVTGFGIFMILMMVLVGGIGVDLMHNEMERTRLQNTLDRAVLAAADLDQPLDSKAVVQDYFDKAGMTDYLTGDPIVDSGVNYRTVTATASSSSPTQFMRMFDVNSLPLSGVGVASERIPKVEISMVLDVSGSMNSNSKMANLRTAANQFVDAVLREETHDMVSISLAPYSQHVNAVLNKTYTQMQMQHFQWNSTSIQSGRTSNTRYDTVCPRYSYEQIAPITQGATKYTASSSDGLMKNICDAAKSKGIGIWAIRFEAPTHGEDTMKDSASSPSHLFSVTAQRFQTLSLQSRARLIS